MRRIYFLIGSIDGARKMTDELLLCRISESHIHVVTHTGELPDDLPEATPDQTSDFFPGLFKGIGLGAITALVAATIVAAIPAVGFGFDELYFTPMFAAIVIFGALVGAFFGALVGSSAPNTLFKNFDKALDEGRILVMADVPRDQVDEIRERVKKAEPGAEYCGIEPLKPVFP